MITMLGCLVACSAPGRPVQLSKRSLQDDIIAGTVPDLPHLLSRAGLRTAWDPGIHDRGIMSAWLGCCSYQLCKLRSLRLKHAAVGKQHISLKVETENTEGSDMKQSVYEVRSCLVILS